jgi:hypothetical protein
MVTLAIAVAFVLAFEAEVAKPYRIPSASMERTLPRARPRPQHSVEKLAHLTLRAGAE